MVDRFFNQDCCQVMLGTREFPLKKTKTFKNATPLGLSAGVYFFGKGYFEKNRIIKSLWSPGDASNTWPVTVSTGHINGNISYRGNFFWL
jgi:hypothetical protein